eukprot:TRINITY_DN81332_c0_g1_i1.p1 TRINITY_DN81332_c0_g1~~TRINITY_DN81332_c0_g1_i1.p1  ORF type:complete len:670 (-),score=165.76 TRINITY_DN81332_c0_g1_i1:124-2133(-)
MSSADFASRRRQGQHQAKTRPRLITSGNRFLGSHCTVLPALENLNGIMVAEIPRYDVMQIERIPAMDITGEILQMRRIAMPFSSTTAGRLYPGRDPKDSRGFRDDVTLPPLPAREAFSRGACSSRSPSPPRSTQWTPRTAGGNVEDREWHVVLQQASFEGGGPPSALGKSMEETCRTLSQVLGDEVSKWRDVAFKARNGSDSATLRTFSSWTEAATLSRKLKDRGLVVRVASRLRDGSAKARSYRIEGLAQKFTGTLQGDLFRLARTLSEQEKTPSMMQDTGWREHIKAHIELHVNVIPDDPVSAYFKAEEERRVTAAMRRRQGFLKLRSISADDAQSFARSKPPSLKGLIDKHMEMLQPEMGQLKNRGATDSTRLEMPGRGPSDKHLASGSPPSQRKKPVVNLSEVVDLAMSSEQEKVDKTLLANAKEMSRLVRTYFFGLQEELPDSVAREKIGTKELVGQLHHLWRRLDVDGSGRVPIEEFRNRSKRMGKDRLMANADYEKLVKWMFAKKSAVSFEDVLKFVWPAANLTDTRTMQRWCVELESKAKRERIAPPPVLPQADVDGLCSIFRLFDDSGDGKAQFEELVTHGLLYPDQKEDFQKEWDKNGDGDLDVFEFCEMMCPTGYRAFEGSLVGSLPDGRKVLYDAALCCWRLEHEESVEQEHAAPAA